MDDDIFHPNKIEKMLSYFLEDYTHKITLVTSYRSYIDENGDSIPDTIHNQRRFQQTTVVDGKEAGDSIIAEFNWIGEPTTPLFRKVDLTESFGVFSDRLYRSGVDIAAWLNLLSKGNLIYIPEPLSKLRLHKKNISKSPEMIVNALQDLMHLLFHAKKFYFLQERDTYRLALKNIYKLLWLRKNQMQVTEEQDQEINYYILLFSKTIKLLYREGGRIMPLPLVSVLIPTYNRPNYFKIALDSVLAQEYPNIEIIITDDSTNDETYSIVAPLIKSFFKHTLFQE
ncbi:glycosyltransferase family 2 protein [Bacillus paranthracis]